MPATVILPRTMPGPKDIDDLAVVRLRKRVRHADRVFEAGSIGTVVFRYASGVAFEVEFGEPSAGVVTVLRADLELA